MKELRVFNRKIEGYRFSKINLLFFTLLSASCVAALQTVGAFLVIALIITPGATAYLLTDNFPKLIIISVIIGIVTSFFGAYFSFFLDGSTGGIIVVLQTLIFILAFGLHIVLLHFYEAQYAHFCRF